VNDDRYGYGIGRTLAALELLADRPASVTELADALRVHPRTARRLVRRLVRDGYAQAGPERVSRYTITCRLVDLGERSKRQLGAQGANIQLDAEPG
jgi:DNA-binding IclR family transcriptional regulator